jgi:hypothetical protein
LKVIIIGCGPAGLAAAHAAVGLGAEVTIYAPGKKTPQRGPLLIQRPIPGINTDHPDGTIHQLVVGGDILDYRYKLYGDVNIGINGDVLRPHYHAWRHTETYDALWDKYSDIIVPHQVSKIEMLSMQDRADLVVTTANARAMCLKPDALPAWDGQPHHFQTARVAITPYCSYPDQPSNTIIFNADPEVPWVRSSLVFGTPVTEWLVELAPPDAMIISKPISTTCNCYPHILRTGRFGAWKNEVWVDSAYWDTYGAIRSRERREELEAIK